MLINIFSSKEIKRCSFNPGLESYPEKDLDGVVIDEKCCNPHYAYIMSGEGSPFNDADFRKAVKKKKPKPKKKPQYTPPKLSALACSQDGLAQEKVTDYIYDHRRACSSNGQYLPPAEYPVHD